MRTGNKVRINMAGVIDVVLRLHCGDYPCTFHVSSDEVHGILGMDFMEQHHVDFQAASKKLFATALSLCTASAAIASIIELWQQRQLSCRPATVSLYLDE